MEEPNENVKSRVDDFAKELAVALRRILDINKATTVELPKVFSDSNLQKDEEAGDQNG